MSVLNILLSHQPPQDLARTLQSWKDVCAPEDLLVAYGGTERNFSAIAHQQKVFIADGRLRTRDHQRERQSYTAVLKQARPVLARRGDVAFVNFMEFDQVPLVRDLNHRQVALLVAERADLLGHHVHRIDGTSHPHFLFHSADAEFAEWKRSISVRADPTVVLSMLATGSFWTRECFDTVTAVDEPIQMYVELFLPTVAHHLGFRVRSYGEQDRFVSHAGERWRDFVAARAEGAWTLHPVKHQVGVADHAA